MVEDWQEIITRRYRESRGDSTILFEAMVALAHKHGMDAVLAHLQRCVIEKRLAWLDAHGPRLARTGNPIMDGYRAFYEAYLGLSIPRDGEIVALTDRRLVTRWWNACPTLAACTGCGLDTRVICRKVYHEPVSIFLSRIDRRLTFARNYAVLRPYGPYCEEIIELSDTE